MNPTLVAQWPDDEMFIFDEAAKTEVVRHIGRSSSTTENAPLQAIPITKTTTLALGDVSNQVGRETILNQATMKTQGSKSMTEVLPLKYDNHKAALVPFSPGMHVLQPVH